GRDPPVNAEPVAQGLAAPEDTFVSRDQEVLLHLGPELGVAEPDAVADRRPEELDVLTARQSPRHSAHSLEAGLGGAAQRLLDAVGRCRPFGEPVQPVHLAVAAEGNEIDLAL